MYSYVKGELVEKLADAVVIEVNGIGYEIKMPQRAMDELPSCGVFVQIYTYLHVREDAMQLYGFLSRDALNLFQLLISVSGIGPKGGLAVLSVLSPDELRFAVLAEDAKAIAKAPGIGGKTAQRVIIELKDKFSLEDAFEQKLEHNQSSGQTNDGASKIKDEAVQALTALGYSATEALQAVGKTQITPETSVEDVLKSALKQMAFL
jgi:Holliday junction DNA helicase RuvA